MNAKLIPTRDDLQFTLLNGREGVGVGLVPSARAGRFVPEPFQLIGAQEPVTPLVALGLKGDLILGGKHTASVVIAQVGLLIAPPDGTGEVNSYLVGHYTTHADLAREFNRRGINTQHVANIRFEHEPGGPAAPLEIHLPDFSMTGKVRGPNQALSFAGNTWVDTSLGTIKMATGVHGAYFGAADLHLTTEPGSGLDQLIGGTWLDFAVLQRFNQIAELQSHAALVKLAKSTV